MEQPGDRTVPEHREQHKEGDGQVPVAFPAPHFGLGAAQPRHGGSSRHPTRITGQRGQPPPLHPTPSHHLHPTWLYPISSIPTRVPVAGHGSGLLCGAGDPRCPLAHRREPRHSRELPAPSQPHSGSSVHIPVPAPPGTAGARARSRVPAAGDGRCRSPCVPGPGAGHDPAPRHETGPVPNPAAAYLGSRSRQLRPVSADPEGIEEASRGSCARPRTPAPAAARFDSGGAGRRGPGPAPPRVPPAQAPRGAAPSRVPARSPPAGPGPGPGPGPGLAPLPRPRRSPAAPPAGRAQSPPSSRRRPARRTRRTRPPPV
ncbi:skin secretory protein xP2-like [Lathamus discolor]|uniref:skin secretory protein xP2-like n=1 Tax=Lathamus discolor TaxID=678569 RepID=UPI0032B756BD